MTGYDEPEIQGPGDEQPDDPYYTSRPAAPYPEEEHRRRRWLAILLSIMVIPLLVAVALAGGNEPTTGSSACTPGAEANGAACPTTNPVPTTTGQIETPGEPVPPPPPTTTPNFGGGVPLPPVTPPTPPAFNPNPPTYTPPAPQPTPPAPPSPQPTPPAPPSPQPTPTPNTPGYTGPPMLTRSDGGKALFKLPNVGGGKTVTKCVTIKYNGNPSARVRLYGILTGTGLDNYIDFKITRGTSPSATNGSCSDFKADTTNYLGDGSGVIFKDLLSEFPMTFESADDEPAQADRERWTNNERHTYKFEVKLRSDNSAQGLTVGMQLRWDARGY